MFYVLKHGWHCQFLDADLKTPHPRKLTFSSPDKFRKMHERLGTDRKLEDRTAPDYAINTGRGSMRLATPLQPTLPKPQGT